MKLFYLSFSTNMKNLSRRIKGFKIWSSAKDYAVLNLLLKTVGMLNSTWPIWSRGNVLYEPCTSSQEAYWRGRPLNIFAWFIGAGGSIFLSRAHACAFPLACSLSLSLSCSHCPPISQSLSLVRSLSLPLSSPPPYLSPLPLSLLPPLPSESLALALAPALLFRCFSWKIPSSWSLCFCANC